MMTTSNLSDGLNSTARNKKEKNIKFFETPEKYKENQNMSRNAEHFNQVRGGDRNEGNSTDPLEKKFESVTSTPTGGGLLKQKGACR
jgi:hypothetical protein